MSGLRLYYKLRKDTVMVPDVFLTLCYHLQKTEFHLISCKNDDETTGLSLSLPKLHIIENSKRLSALSGYKITFLKGLIYNEENTYL